MTASTRLAPDASRLAPKTGRPAVFLDRDGTLNRQVIATTKAYPAAASRAHAAAASGKSSNCAAVAGG